jgi:hypothetical protein
MKNLGVKKPTSRICATKIDFTTMQNDANALFGFVSLVNRGSLLNL